MSGDELTPDHLDAPEERSPEALREYGRQLALDEMLRQAYGSEVRDTRDVEPAEAIISPIPFSRKKNRRVNWPAFVAMAACLAVLGVLVVILVSDASSRPEVAMADSASSGVEALTVVAVDGEVTIRIDGGVNTSVNAGDQIESNATIASGHSGALKMEYPDGTQLVLQSGSKMNGNFGSDGAKQLNLLAGRLALDVAPQPEGRPLRVTTPYAEAQVIGTRLALNVKDDHTEMTVEEGVVGFKREADPLPLLVQAGFVAELGPELERLEANDSADPEVLDFTLISVATGLPVDGYDPIPNDAVIAMSELPVGGINIRVNTAGRIRDMVIKSTHEPTFLRERWPPYSVAGDEVQFGGDYFALNIQPQVYRYDASPVDVNGKRGIGKKLSIRFVE